MSVDKYAVYNGKGGRIPGEYEAEDENGALEAMAKAAGYKDYAQAQRDGVRARAVPIAYSHRVAGELTAEQKLRDLIDSCHSNTLVLSTIERMNMHEALNEVLGYTSPEYALGKWLAEGNRIAQTLEVTRSDGVTFRRVNLGVMHDVDSGDASHSTVARGNSTDCMSDAIRAALASADTKNDLNQLCPDRPKVTIAIHKRKG